MADEAVFMPVLPSYDGFFKDLSKNSKKGGEQAGKDFAGAMENSLKQAEKRVESLSKAQERAHNRATDAADKTRVAQLKLSEAIANAATPASKLADLTARYEKAQRDETSAAKAAEKAAKDLASAHGDVQKAVDQADDAIDSHAATLDGFGGSIKDAIGQIGLFTAGLAGVAGVGAFAGLGMELSNEISLINMQLGNTGDKAVQVGDSINSTLKGGVAGSAEEAANAIGAIESQFDNLGSAGEQTSAQLSDNFLAFSKVFGVDIAESTQMAGQLISNGLATDAENAADLMTTAFQRVPAAMRDELPDLLNEYGTFFSSMGYSGEETLSMFVGMSEEGTIAMDKLGDAIKETGIRATDLGDTGAMEALNAIGLAGEDIPNRLLAGGETARAAMEQMSQALLNVQDPAERASAAVALIGTPVEDLNKAGGLDQFLTSLSGAENAMEGFGGSSQALADEIANSLDGRLNALKGTVQTLASDAFMWAWDTLQNNVIPAFKDFGDWVQRNEDWIKPLGVTVGILTAGYTALAIRLSIMEAGSFLAWMSKLSAFTRVQTAAQAALNVVMSANVFTWVALAIVALVGGLIYFFTQTETGKAAWETFTNALSAGWEWVKSTVFDAFTATINALKIGWEIFTGALGTAWNWVKDTFVAGWELIKTLVFDAFTFYIDTWKLIFETAINLVAGAWTWLKDGLVAGWDIIRTGVFDAFNFYVDLVKNTFQLGMDGIGAGWNWMRDTLSAGWSWIRDNVFSAFNSSVDLMRSGAEIALNGIGTAFDWLRSKTAVPINFVIDPVYSSIRNAWGAVANLVGLPELPKIEKIGGFAEGTARVPGTRTRYDNVHMVSTDGRFGMSLRGGEGVLVPEAVDALGESTVNGLNAAALRGGAASAKRFLGAFANGGVIDSITGIVAEKFPGMSITSTYRPGDSGHHGTGNAVDFSNGTDSTPEMREAAQYFADNYGGSLLELIHSPFNNNIKNGQSVGDGFGFYGAGTMAAHRNHVHIAAGSPLAGGGTGGVLGVLSGAVNFVGDQAKKAWDSVINAVPKFEGAGLIAELPGAFLNKAATSAWDFVKDKIGAIGAFTGDPGAGVEQWRPLVEKVLQAKGFSVDLADTVLRRMNQESGGNPQAINNWDSNAAAGIPSKGLMQVIDPTFAANADPGYSDIWDPESNIRASMNYAIGRYGSLPAAYNREGGYHEGGLAPAGQGFMAKTALEPEMVLNPAMTQAFIDWMAIKPESMSVMWQEVATAFASGDWGYGELSSVIGNEDVAQAIVNGAAALGDLSRTAAPILADAGKSYATSGLNMLGLGGLVEIADGVTSKVQEIGSSEEFQEAVKKVTLDPNRDYNGKEIAEKLRELGLDIEEIKAELGGSVIGGLVGIA